MPSTLPLRLWAALAALLVLASVIILPPVELPQPMLDSSKPRLDVTPVPRGETPEPLASAKPAVPAKSVMPTKLGPAEVSPLARRHETPNVPDSVLSNTLIHTVRPGESVTSMARRYLPQTIFMTTVELEAAIREANAGKWGKSPSPGDPAVIPGYEAAPVTEKSVLVPKGYEVRAIYLTGLMAGSRHGIELIRRWKELGGNSIVFDIKDSDGSLSVPFSHELVPKRQRPYIRNLPKFARFLHSLRLHSIARIAVFRDEQLVERHPELAVQSRRFEQPWRENGKLVWTDPSRPEVQDYNIALAKLAATSGIDEIQFDYIRFPAEGDQKDTHFFFQEVHPDWTRSSVITDFLSRAYAELHSLGVLVSLDVFGVMAWQRPVDLAHTGQDIASMAEFCDVLSPMIYPSHFFGMDGYERPGDAPQHFIGMSMERFQEITEGTGVVLRPWLQAFGWRTKTYSPDYIITQVRVSKEKDGVGFLFWNARNDYSRPFVAMTQLRALPSRSSSGEQSQAHSKKKPAATVSGRESLAPAATEGAPSHASARTRE